MSNYPNMSYCMCENTLEAMQQVLSVMEDEGLTFIEDLDRVERRAFWHMISTCKKFIQVAALLEAKLEAADIEVDSD
jgi:hypothetical protein